MSTLGSRTNPSSPTDTQEVLNLDELSSSDVPDSQIGAAEELPPCQQNIGPFFSRQEEIFAISLNWLLIA